MRRVLIACLAFATTAAAEIPLEARRSGYEFMGRDTRAIQDDDAVNPGWFWVLEGEALWNQKAGEANRSCADCHGEAAQSMRGVAARHPAYDAQRARPLSLGERINACRTERQAAPALPHDSRALLALSTLVARHSRGMPVRPDPDPRSLPFREAGRALFLRRQGQLDLACAHCHDRNWGKALGGNTIPQAHPTGYPLYRLEWQTLGSLERRLRNCVIGTRAEPYAYGAPEHVALELYLMWRARGMRMESPAVRP